MKIQEAISNLPKVNLAKVKKERKISEEWEQDLFQILKENVLQEPLRLGIEKSKLIPINSDFLT